MVIAIEGSLFGGYLAFGPYDCPRSAIRSRGSAAEIIPLRDVGGLGDNRIVLVGSLENGFRAYGPFRNDGHLADWKRQQFMQTGNVRLSLLLQSET